MYLVRGWIGTSGITLKSKTQTKQALRSTLNYQRLIFLLVIIKTRAGFALSALSGEFNTHTLFIYIFCSFSFFSTRRPALRHALLVHLEHIKLLQALQVAPRVMLARILPLLERRRAALQAALWASIRLPALQHVLLVHLEHIKL